VAGLALASARLDGGALGGVLHPSPGIIIRLGFDTRLSFEGELAARGAEEDRPSHSQCAESCLRGRHLLTTDRIANHTDAILSP